MGGNVIRGIMLAHLYDIASIIFADQIMLAVGLEEDCRVECLNESVFLSDFLFSGELINHLDFASNSVVNDGKGLDTSQAQDVIAPDNLFFKAWVENRKDLELYLPEYCKALYSANTRYWMLNYCNRYQRNLIDSSIP